MKLSILIPSKNEPYLEKTLFDLMQKIKGDTDIFVGLDGMGVQDASKIIAKFAGYQNCPLFVFTEESIGQRAMTNKLALKTEADYLLKCDAHVSFSEGFEVAMMSEMDNKTILAPLLLVLDPITWQINGKKQMAQFVFDRNFVMQHRDGDVGETMTVQGSAWMISKENYFKWNVCDESFGSWGGQAVELGIRAWLNGGKCKTTRSAYYGHVFRHLDNEFPYDRGENPGKFATEELKRRYENHPKVQELFDKYSI